MTTLGKYPASNLKNRMFHCIESACLFFKKQPKTAGLKSQLEM